MRKYRLVLEIEAEDEYDRGPLSKVIAATRCAASVLQANSSRISGQLSTVIDGRDMPIETILRHREAPRPVVGDPDVDLILRRVR